MCAPAQRGASGTAAPPPGSPPSGCRRRAGRDPFYVAARPPDSARRAPGGAGVVNLAPCGEVTGERPAARAPMKRHCASLARRGSAKRKGWTEMRPSLPAPKFFLFLARLAVLPLKRRVKGTESQTSPQTCRVLPPPFVLLDLPGKPFLESLYQPPAGRGRGEGAPTQPQPEDPGPSPAHPAPRAPSWDVPSRPGLAQVSPGSGWPPPGRGN